MLILARTYARRRQHGVSMVELLVGIAVGLVLTSWAISLFVTSLGSNRNLIAQARVDQSLRAAADLIARDLRRAGYWGNAISGTIATTGVGGVGTTTQANPYRAVTADTAAPSIAYNFSRDAGTDNNNLDNNEQFAFSLSGGAIQMQTASGTVVPVTDPNVVTVTSMTITPSETSLSVGNACSTTCTVGTPNCPATMVRSYDIVLQGQYVKDSSVVRTLRTNIRVRNDQFSGYCPA